MEELFNQISTFNFWHFSKKEVANQFGFSRDFYLNKILKYIQNSLIKVIVGQRRTGKSYLLRQIANHIIQSGV